MRYVLSAVALSLLCLYCIDMLLVDEAYGHHDRQCNVRINIANTEPVIYESNERENPDGSLYPGDAFHFFAEYSAHPECTNVVTTLKSTVNLHFKSAIKVLGSERNTERGYTDYYWEKSQRPHRIIIEKWVPTHVNIHTFYKIEGYTERHCWGGYRAGCHEPRAILAGEPSFSFRADKDLSQKEKNLLLFNKLGGRDCYSCTKYFEKVTQKWFLTLKQVPFLVGVDRHPLEDESSVDAFEESMMSQCSNLRPNTGCIFGHVEVPTKIDDRDEICLFAEMYRLGIEFDPEKETDECVKRDKLNLIEASVRGKGQTCTHGEDGECKSFIRTDTDIMHADIYSPFGDVNFEFLQVYDRDGFPSKNNDGTYYINRTAGIHATPDARFKDLRIGILSFDHTADYLTEQLQKSFGHETCDEQACDIIMKNKMFTDLYRTITHGDLLSSYFSDSHLGIAPVQHTAEMYNIERYIGEYTGTAEPLVVVYDPIINDTATWTRLADGGLLSYDNRYAIAVNYLGSAGGGPDDGDAGVIHEDRPVMINDMYGAYLMSNVFGTIHTNWLPNATTSVSHGISDLEIDDSVYDYTSEEDMAFFDKSNHTHTPPAVVWWNATAQKTMVESAGFARLLRDVEVSQIKIEEFYINVTSYETLLSRDFGGSPLEYLATSKYDFPWGFLSIPLNVTAYFVDESYDGHIDSTVRINHIDINDTDDAVGEFVSTVDFYLNKHDTPELAYMHMADMYKLNPKAVLDDKYGTAVILLNKTGINYDVRAYNTLINERFFSDEGGEYTIDDFMNTTKREFFLALSYFDVEISATGGSDGATKTNVVKMGGVELSDIMRYRLNMNHDNSLFVNKADSIAMVPSDVHFGSIEQLYVDEEPYDDATCGDGCVVFLDGTGSVDIMAVNEWGGIASAKNVTGYVAVGTAPEEWIDVAPLRILYFALGLAGLYVMYRAIRWIWTYKRNA